MNCRNELRPNDSYANPLSHSSLLRCLLWVANRENDFEVQRQTANKRIKRKTSYGRTGAGVASLFLRLTVQTLDPHVPIPNLVAMVL